MPSLSRSIPRAPGWRPLVGHTFILLRRPLEFLRSLPATGNLVRVDIGTSPMCVATTAELTQHILADSRTFDKGGFLFDKARRLTGNGILASPHATHKRQRRLVQPAFRQERIPRYAHIMRDETAVVLDSWRDDTVIDIASAMRDLTARTTARSMFAGEIAGPAASQVAQWLPLFTTRIYRQMIAPTEFIATFPTPANRRYEQALSRVHGSIDKMIASYRASGVDQGDLLSMLLAARDDEGSQLSDAEIHDQVISLFLGGIETTSATLSWALHLVAQHPVVADQLRAEVDSVLGGRAAAWEDVPQLAVAQRIVTETLRLYPPGWLLTRKTTCDTTLGDHSVPKGVTVVYSPYLLHHDPELFPQADDFDPDRWLPERATHLPRGAFVPFGGGARKCLGDVFGVTEATLVLAAIAARWTLQSVPGAPVKPVPRASLTPDVLPMRLRRRG